jgi:hypothetical protein
MADAMGRSLFGTLFGAFTAKPQDVLLLAKNAQYVPVHQMTLQSCLTMHVAL